MAKSGGRSKATGQAGSGGSRGGRSGGDRERIDNPQTGSQYVRRDEQGQFREVENVGRASRGDQHEEAENESRRGQGDRGDREE